MASLGPLRGEKESAAWPVIQSGLRITKEAQSATEQKARRTLIALTVELWENN